MMLAKRVLVGALVALSATLPLRASAADWGASVRVPASIPRNCSADATQQLGAWIATVPDHAVVSFPSSACYRIDGTLELAKRVGLSLSGNGTTLRSVRPPADQRPLLRVVDSRNIGVRNFTLDGSYGRGGTFDSDLQHAHAIDVRGSSVHVERVTMTDVAGDCVYFGLGSNGVKRASGDVLDSSCLRTGRNAIAVVGGDDIVVRRVKTDAIGYDVFDVEPNPGRGYGSNNVVFADNTIGSYALNVYSIVESGPVRNQSFVGNRVVGHGLKIAVSDPTHAGFRPAGVTIAGNSSDTAQRPSALNFDNVDRLTVKDNVVPMTAGPMAAVQGSCGVVFSGNRYPGGSSEAFVRPHVCSFAPMAARRGASVRVSGSGFAEATRVTVNGVASCFSVGSSGRVRLVIPNGARTGPIAVTTHEGTATTRTKLVVKPGSSSSGCRP